LRIQFQNHAFLDETYSFTYATLSCRRFYKVVNTSNSLFLIFVIINIFTFRLFQSNKYLITLNTRLLRQLKQIRLLLIRFGGILKILLVWPIIPQLIKSMQLILKFYQRGNFFIRSNGLKVSPNLLKLSLLLI